MYHMPVRQDPNFWWANANFILTPPFTGETQADGFHLKGNMTYSGGSLINRQFGVASRYELHSNRIPRPDRGPWRSAPHVEITGRVIGSTTAGDIFSGDQWNKCWMHRRQTLYQFVFAPPGTDNRRIIGENREIQELIFLEGSSKYKDFVLPGFQNMPVVILNQNSIFPGLSVWAELEILFHVQLEGGSTLWLNPDVLIRMFQWPLEPI
ncbi:hypothetical protein SAMN04488542_11142 [Fontibacillus panacisegetis]|uniref:Uncharacterized protein n=1 Tax=Fontibacillus panacisegetis TaxID=670482 RepID=A0A1G7LAJ9_9BACL|nr:hypothetical protein [Fontibacillus panacisegetis]SDF46019.1 hypothetical protein SAMN04488542_11142 [Fontibacillus panacisegetis]